MRIEWRSARLAFSHSNGKFSRRWPVWRVMWETRSHMVDSNTKLEDVWETQAHVLGSKKVLPRVTRCVESDCGIVTYINTDLNDFGKGNDLRGERSELIHVKVEFPQTREIADFYWKRRELILS